MKKILFQIAVFTVLNIYTTLYASIVVTTVEGQEILLYEESHALIVGNSDYKHFDHLPGAKQDAQEIASVLKRKGFVVQLELNLTRTEFDKKFTDFVLNRGKKENTRIFFYYAGHGATLPMAGDEKMGYILMIDTPQPDKDPSGFVTQSIDMQYMILKSKMILARHVLYMFDSCFSGSILNFRTPIKVSKINHQIKYPVRQFITAGSANEKVPDRSFFKRVFLDLIEGRVEEPFKDGYITGEELGYYLKSKVPYYFPYQHPQFGRIKNPHLDKGDFVFLIGNTNVIANKGINKRENSVNKKEINNKQYQKKNFTNQLNGKKSIEQEYTIEWNGKTCIIEFLQDKKNVEVQVLNGTLKPVNAFVVYGFGGLDNWVQYSTTGLSFTELQFGERRYQATGSSLYIRNNWGHKKIVITFEKEIN